MFSGLIASVSLGAALIAQDPAVLERRLARLDVLRRAAGAVLMSADSARREALDTIRAGALFILVRPEESAIVRQGAELAWSQLDSLYGDEAMTLARRPMVFWFLRQPARTIPQFVTKFEPVIGDPSYTREDVARQLTSGAAKLLRESADSTLSNWFGSLLVPLSRPSVALGGVYLELVSAPSAAVRRCYEGDPASCRAALGLLESRDRVTAWFDDDERRALVRKTTVMDRSAHRGAAEACLVAHSDAGCVEVLRSLPYLDPPLSIEARHSFARLALVAGGRDAYGRLLRSAGRPLSERFALAAGLPPDSVALRWRAAIVGARPKTVTLAAAGGWAALGWAVLFGLLALRSTRWR